jgi:dGTP triphosphohydrolase
MSGEERAQCTARSKRSGERCKAYPVRGATVCNTHGGAAIQVRAAAQRRLAAEKVESEIRNAIAFESREGVQDPLEQLARLADESMAMKEALAGRINELKSIRYSAHGSGTEQLRAEVALYERAMDRTARFLDLLVKSGFEERRTRMSEEQGAAIVQALRAIFARLMLTPEQQQLLPTVVPEELRRLSAIEGRVVR